MARKSKYGPDLVAKLKQALELGATHELACDYAGISPDTFYTWMKSKPEFSETIGQSQGQGAVKLLEKINKAIDDGEWRAAAWILERRYPHAYGRQVQEMTSTKDAPMIIEVVYQDKHDDATK